MLMYDGRALRRKELGLLMPLDIFVSLWTLGHERERDSCMSTSRHSFFMTLSKYFVLPLCKISS